MVAGKSSMDLTMVGVSVGCCCCSSARPVCCRLLFISSSLVLTMVGVSVGWCFSPGSGLLLMVVTGVLIYPGVKSGDIVVLWILLRAPDTFLQICSLLQLRVLSTSCSYWYFYDAGRWVKVEQQQQKNNAKTQSPLLSDFLRQCGGVAVIDGGLATELERHGADLNDPLWSAKCLLDSPHLIRGVHLDYLEAGADIIITASYQATIQGFEAKGFSTTESEELLRKSVGIACEARNVYYDRRSLSNSNGNEDNKNLKRRPILVAASVGSYGAYLADGSEYSGDYGDAMTLEALKDFHRRRVQVLAASGADLIAFETIPNKLEAQAFAELLEEERIGIPAWFSFNSKDGVNVVSGDSLTECISIADSCSDVIAVGINCTPPRFIQGLITSIKTVTSKPILIYPNSGESYDGNLKEWVQNTGVSDEDFVSYVNKWCEVGAALVGGCCRTTPNTIRAICKILPDRSTASSPQ